MITIKPYGGLGNRVRVLYSVLSINKDLDRQIKVLWNCNAELNCQFEKLFATPQNCQIHNIEQGFIRRAYRFSFNRLHLSKLRQFKYDLVLSDARIVELREKHEGFHDLLNKSSVYIESCHQFFKSSKVTDFLTINPVIDKEARKLSRSFNSSTYGIHIRRSDNKMSKKYSPPSVFKQLIENKLKEEEGVQFFLATDSKKVENDFLNDFKGRIITSKNKVFDRNSEQGIKNALIDMICLSKTKKIYGSYYSSFSSVSAMLSGIEYEDVIADNTDLDVLDLETF